MTGLKRACARSVSTGSSPTAGKSTVRASLAFAAQEKLPPARNWSRFANKAQLPISAILEDSVLHKDVPHWNELTVSRAKFEELPPKWSEELMAGRRVRLAAV